MLKQARNFLFQEIPPPKRAARLLDLDAARGFAIILVVIGHIISKGSVPEGNNWFFILFKMIYQFHMPFFMVLSGLTFALSLPLFRAPAEIRAYSFKRVMPLIIPFAVLGLLILVGKQVALHFVNVSNPPGTFISGVTTLLLIPTESVARFLWFIYVLSIYLVLVPYIFYFLGRKPVLLLAAGVVLQFFNWTEVLAIQDAVSYLPFFAMGMVLWNYRSSWAPMSPWLLWPGAAVFISLLVMSNYYEVPKWLAGASSILPLLGLAHLIPTAIQRFLAYLGQNSLTIYLFNVIVLGLVKELGSWLLSWDGINFLLYFPLLTAAGVGVPLVIKSASLKWFPKASKFI